MRAGRQRENTPYKDFILTTDYQKELLDNPPLFLLVIDRFNKQYAKASLEDLKLIGNTGNTFPALENLLLNKLFLPGESKGISPSGINTPMLFGGHGEASKFGMERYVLGRACKPRNCEPEEVADLVLFLASDDSKAINGADINIDVGCSAY